MKPMIRKFCISIENCRGSDCILWFHVHYHTLPSNVLYELIYKPVKLELDSVTLLHKIKPLWWSLSFASCIYELRIVEGVTAFCDFILIIALFHPTSLYINIQTGEAGVRFWHTITQHQTLMMKPILRKRYMAIVDCRVIYCILWLNPHYHTLSSNASIENCKGVTAFCDFTLATLNVCHSCLIPVVCTNRILTIMHL